MARARGRPLILSHLVTSRCNAVCPTCLWRDRAPEDLPLETIRWLYRESQRAGIPQLVIWGGEPLLRADLPLLLAAARSTGHFVTLITNGWLLPRRWDELRGLVDVLVLSLDDVGEAHDRLRGLPGLFERLDAFVRSLEGDQLRPRLLVNTVLSKGNRGALRRVAPIAQAWGAGLFFCPMETGEMRETGFAELKDELALPARELQEQAALAATLQRAGYPLLASGRYLKQVWTDPRLTGYRCRIPSAILTVQADGGVRDCLHRERPLLYVQDVLAAGRPLSDVFSLPRYAELLAEAGSCTACNNPDVLETSWLWELRPFMLGRVLRLARR